MTIQYQVASPENTHTHTKWTQQVVHACVCVSVYKIIILKEKEAIHLKGSKGKDMGGVGGTQSKGKTM